MKRFILLQVLLSAFLLSSCFGGEENEFDPLLMCICFDGVDKTHDAEFMLFEDCDYVGIETNGLFTSLITKSGEKKPIQYYTYHDDKKDAIAIFKNALVGKYVLVCRPKYRLYMAKKIDFKKEPIFQTYACDVKDLLDKYEWESPEKDILVDWVDPEQSIK